MKKIILTTFITILSVLLSSCGRDGIDDYYTEASSINGGRPSLKIGVLYENEADIAGVLDAHNTYPTVEISGEVYVVQLAIFNSIIDDEDAKSAAEFFVESGVSVVISSCPTALYMLTDNYFRDAGIIVLGITHMTDMPTASNYLPMYLPYPDAGREIANEVILRYNPEAAYVIANYEDDIGREFAAYFIEVFGRENVIYEIFPRGTNDFTDYILSAKEIDADILFSATNEHYAALIINQMQSKGLNIPVFERDGWLDIEAAGYRAYVLSIKKAQIN